MYVRSLFPYISRKCENKSPRAEAKNNLMCYNYMLLVLVVLKPIDTNHIAIARVAQGPVVVSLVVLAVQGGVAQAVVNQEGLGRGAGAVIEPSRSATSSATLTLDLTSTAPS